ncbi:MAG: radical SAM protein [Proteobacteria bacterium]|nr:radical SAM protein [Pseudomonadota bacterium]
MRILLVNVPVREDQVPSNFPTGLGIIANVLRGGGHDVEILDVNAHRHKPEEVLSLATSSRADAIGVSGLISTYKYQCWLGGELKELLPDTPLISGGGCATSAPDHLIKNAPYDILVMGEGERTVLELVNSLENDEPLEDVKGLVFRCEDGIAHTESRPLEENLDAFPLPAYDLFPTELYAENPIWQFTKKSMNLISSRGCPMNCNFCYNLFGKRSYRKRGVGPIIDEVRLLKDNYGIECFAFVDDNLTINKKHLFAVCDALADEKIEWGCHGRVDTVDDERLSRMSDSGCTWLGFGIESGSQRILDAMNKRVNVEQAKEAMKKTTAHGIFANATFIYGYPGENEESIIESMRFMMDTDIVNDGFFATPYPGTELYKYALERGLIPDEHAFFTSLNNAYNFSLNLTDMSDEKFFDLKSRSSEEVRLAAMFSHAEITEENEVRYLELADSYLKHDCLLPDLKGYILLSISEYYHSRGERQMALSTRALARQFGVFRRPRSPLRKQNDTTVQTDKRGKLNLSAASSRR